ncbi:MAG: hypothetical protein BA863_17645 [Desulfovibrio sp. S3730MH75]|nr:MAG: hypothetical protein BA863_17645 [Desulfovibrio sp. S3730MH75]
MGCCIGAEHSDWCKNDGYEIVYVDREGKEYCVFHAPADCKYVSPYVEGVGEKPGLISGDDFNAKVFDRIDAVIDAGMIDWLDKWDEFDWENWNPRCNFAGAIFFVDISFSTFNKRASKYLPPINFNSCQFCEEVSFDFSNFSGVVCFHQSKFNGEANFRYSRFRGRAYFNNTKFDSKADFG